jgi:RNA polymerase sigma factor (sigma-70 family)
MPRSDTPTEEDIVSLIGKGDGKSQETGVRALYDLMAKPMLRFFVHLGLSPDEARDVLQETFVKVVRSASAFSPGGSAKAWLWQIARNCLTDHLRQTARVRKHETVFDEQGWQSIQDTIPERPHASSTSVEKCVSEGLARFANAMPDRAYVITLQMEGMSIQEIAHQIGRTVAATKEYLSQCRKKVAPFISRCTELLAAEAS